MPAVRRGGNLLATEGGLTLSRADKNLRISSLIVNVDTKTASAKLAGSGQRRTLLRLTNVKNGSWFRANLHLAKSEAAVLNEALGTDVFRPRMRVGQLAFTPA